MKKHKNYDKGFTILELTISIIIFGLFMAGIYATFNTGLKSWQIGETKSDIHQKAEIVLTRVIKDLKFTNLLSMQIENNGDPDTINRYICFETPVDRQEGKVKTDINQVGAPVWQGYILYYMAQPDVSENKKDLFRRFVSRADRGLAPSIHPVTLVSNWNSLGTYINSTSGEKISTVAKDIYSIDFTRNGGMITINVCFKKHIRSQAKVAFSPDGDSNKGIEIIELKDSVNPEN